MFPTPASVRWSRIAALTGRLPASRAAARAPSRVNAALERLRADPRVEVGLELARLEQEPRAEAPDVAIGDVRSVV